MKYSIIIFTLLIFCDQCTTKKITPNDLDQDLHKHYKKILAFREDTSLNSWDSLENENKIFRRKMKFYTSMYPFTLNYDFDSLRSDNIVIVTTDDRLFRIYSWDNMFGGSMRFFENLIQFKSNDNVHSKLYYDTTNLKAGEYIPYYFKIFTLNSECKIYYLAINCGIYSGRDASESIKIFTIDNNEINDTVKLIKTTNGFSNEIKVSYNRHEEPQKLINYNSSSQTIHIPIVLEEGIVSDKFIAYKFNGQYFEKVLNQ
ncbi:MAG: hypothetical protein IPQ02_03595 [Saprospiraceae bacterium]|nr:hypothetical protein [Candidatus Defluviibacterium haderslevense]